MSQNRYLRSLTRVGLCALALAGVLQLAARAQELDLPPPPTPVAILVADKPVVTVDLRGDHGPVRVTGTLEAAPEAPVDYGSATTAWRDIHALVTVVQPAEGFPAGSFRLALVSDGYPLAQPGGANIVSSLYSTPGGGRRVLRLPEGNMTLSGKPFGRLTFPLSRLIQYRQEPIRGDVEKLPDAGVKVELFSGVSVTIPLTEVQVLRRNLASGTISLTLSDEQTFTGKLLELPKVSIAFTGGMPAALPLERIVVLERRTGARRL
jgi:hypothetical protein